MMTLFDDEQILKANAKDIENRIVRETAVRMIKKGKMYFRGNRGLCPCLVA